VTAKGLDQTTGSTHVRGVLTLREIRQQPELWPSTLERVASAAVRELVNGRTAIVCGAGTSAYAASAIASSWVNARAIPTTDLLLYAKQDLARLVPDIASNGVLVSVARSGDSPESVGVILRMQKMFPGMRQLAITCNEHGQLARLPDVKPIVLHPLTNDRSLAMTSSFSNLILAGLAVAHGDVLEERLPRIAANVKNALSNMETIAQRLTSRAFSRVMVLTSAGLAPLASEACLKVLEMTAGRIVALPETFLGVRHGPMSFLRPDSLVLCVLSSDDEVRRYELDLLRELRQKNLGYLIIVGAHASTNELAHESVPAVATGVPDYLRTPFEIVFAQLLAYHLSIAAGLDPDNPSPDGVITRVVQKFKMYE
jgi:tagatose-6-phosphate ketose/aldose isomerase